MAKLTLPPPQMRELARWYARDMRVTGDLIREKANEPVHFEIFSGNAHVSRSALSAGFHVAETIDINQRMQPSLRGDVTDSDFREEVRAHAATLMRAGHVVAAHWSPDCSNFSVAHTVGERDVERGLYLAKCGLDLMHVTSRTQQRLVCTALVWTLENPFHNREYAIWNLVDAHPVTELHYCQFGWECKKPTGIAASDPELKATIDGFARFCPGPGRCASMARGATRHRADTQSLLTDAKKAIPAFLAHSLMGAVRARVMQLVPVLADMVDAEWVREQRDAQLTKGVVCVLRCDPRLADLTIREVPVRAVCIEQDVQQIPGFDGVVAAAVMHCTIDAQGKVCATDRKERMFFERSSVVFVCASECDDTLFVRELCEYVMSLSV